MCTETVVRECVCSVCSRSRRLRRDARAHTCRAWRTRARAQGWGGGPSLALRGRARNLRRRSAGRTRGVACRDARATHRDRDRHTLRSRRACGRRRYAKEFNSLLSAYQAANDIDLTRDHDPPTDNLYIRVNVLRDIGQFVGPESGVNIDLKRGDLSYLRRGDVEHLVRQGAVKQDE